MESYTERSDMLEKSAKNISHDGNAAPYTSCYASLMEQHYMMEEANEVKASARSIRKKLSEIIDEGLEVPTGSLLQKAVITICKRKVTFSNK